MFHTNNESENCTNQEIYCAVLKTIVLCRKSKGLLSMKLCFWYLACRSHIFCCTVFSFYPGKSVGKQSRRVLCLSGSWGMPAKFQILHLFSNPCGCIFFVCFNYVYSTSFPSLQIK